MIWTAVTWWADLFVCCSVLWSCKGGLWCCWGGDCWEKMLSSRHSKLWSSWSSCRMWFLIVWWEDEWSCSAHAGVGCWVSACFCEPGKRNVIAELHEASSLRNAAVEALQDGCLSTMLYCYSYLNQTNKTFAIKAWGCFPSSRAEQQEWEYSIHPQTERMGS